MTEQEFRQALKTTVGDAGLSPYRQQQVLAQMKGEERTVRTSHKMKIALILAAILLLGSTAGVATGMIGYANWNGTTSDTPFGTWHPTAEPIPRGRVRSDRNEAAIELMNSLLNSVPAGTAIWISDSTGFFLGVGRIIPLRLSDLDTAQQQIVPSVLPWPTHLPEGYVLTGGFIDYLCSSEGDYKTIRTEITEEDFTVEYMTFPQEHTVLTEYSLVLEDAEGHHLTIHAGLASDSTNRYLYAGDYSELEVVQVTGMDNALLLSTGADRLLRMRTSLPEQIQCLELDRTFFKGPFVVVAYDEIRIDIYADALSLQELESIFAK